MARHSLNRLEVIDTNLSDIYKLKGKTFSTLSSGDVVKAINYSELRNEISELAPIGTEFIVYAVAINNNSRRILLRNPDTGKLHSSRYYILGDCFGRRLADQFY